MRRSTTALLLVAAVALAVTAVLMVAMPAGAGDGQWTTGGPWGGDVNTVVHLSDGTAFCGTYAGVFRLASGESTWTRVSTGLGNQAVFGLAVTSDDTLIAASSGGPSGGLWRSTNSGDSWQNASSGAYNLQCVLACADDTLIAGANGGCYKSTDGGLTWSAAATGMASTNIMGLAQTPDATILAGAFGSPYVYKSTDGGESWTGIGAAVARAVSAVFGSADGGFIAGTYGGGAYKSTDGGSSWPAVNNGAMTAFTAVRGFASTQDDTIVAAGYYAGALVSTDNGSNWSAVNTGFGSDIRARTIAISAADDWLLGQNAGTSNPGGVFRSANRGGNWTDLSAGIASRECLPLVAKPNGDMLTGAMYQGVCLSTDKGSSWTLYDSGLTDLDVWALAVTPDATILAGTNSTVFSSQDGGVTWAQLGTGLQDGGPVVRTFLVAPDGSLLAGLDTSGTYRLPAGGGAWAASNAGLPAGSMTTYDLAVTPDATILACGYFGVYKSTNNGANWTSITPGMNTTSLWVESPTTYLAGTVGGLYRTTNAGASWAAYGSGLPITSIKDIIRSPLGPMWAAVSDKGVYMSLDGGANWTQFNTGGIGANTPWQLALSPDNTTLYATIYRRSVYQYTLDTTPPVTTLTTTPPAPDGDAGWYRTGPAIRLERDKAGSTYYQWDGTAPGSWSTYATTLTAANGTHTLNYYSVSSMGVSETPANSATFRTDTQAPLDPVLSSSSHVVNVASTNQNVQIQWAGASDALSGVDGFSVSWSANTSAQPDTVKDYEESVNTTTTTLADGSWWFNLRTKDNAGNWTSTAHFGPIVIDAVAPVSTVTTVPASPDGANGWYVTTPDITLSANETSTIQYQWDGTGGGWSTFATTLTAAEGTHTLYHRAIDTAGNTETAQSATFKTDTVAPIDPTLSSTTHTTGTPSNVKPISVTLSGATDALSGVDGFSVLANNSPGTLPPAVKNVEENQTVLSVNPPTDGDWWFHVRTVDNAGNWTSTAHIGPFVIDTQAPTSTLTTVPAAPDGANGWYVTTPDITLSANETSTIQYQWDGTGGAWSTFTTTLTAAEGTHTLYHRAIDTAGNTETARSATFKTDTVAPTDPTPTCSTNPIGVPSNNPTVTVDLSGASDANSGVDGVSISWSANTSAQPDMVKDAKGSLASTTTVLADGTWWFNIRTVDNAGNWTSTRHLGPFEIDTVVPDKPGFTSVFSGDRFADFTWVNPTDPDFDRVRLLRSTVGYASDADGTGITPALLIGTDQTLVYEGAGTTHKDTGLTNGVTYYYTLFARDTAGNWTAFDAALAKPIKPRGKAWLSMPRTPYSVRRGQTFAIYGYLKPRHSGWTKTKVLKKTATGWRFYKTVWIPNHNHLSFTKYSRGYKMFERGTYAIRAYHGPDGMHRKSMSMPRYFKVK